MDILIHTLSGIAVGTVISSFLKKGILNNLLIIGFSGLGGALPDFDAISLWSGFDRTLGKLCGLSNSGEVIYFSKFWYSHHGFLHSILASLILAICIGVTFYFIKTRFKKNAKETLTESLQINSLILVGFVSGFIIHLFEDMPTPACNWGGVRLLWPFKLYIGGTGEIWWWNNYDIFIIVVGSILINGLILSLKRFIKFDIRKITAIVFLIGLTLAIIQIKTRNYDFNYIGQTPKFQEYEQKSKEIQREILGSTSYRLIVKFDNKMRFNF